MAVSQGKMLGHYSWGPGGYKCSCCKADSTRYRKIAERREVSAELAAELCEALAAAERGETDDLGSFAQYADD